MDALNPVLKSHPGPSVLVFCLLFRVVHRLLQRLPVPKVVKQNELHEWKWRNLAVSMVHSLLTGTWALTCVLVWPETLSNIHSYHTPLSYLLVCVSTGRQASDPPPSPDSQNRRMGVSSESLWKPKTIHEGL